MGEEFGIGLDDLAWIQRDQFVYYIEMAHALSGAQDWARLRQTLLAALTAAFGLDASPTRADPTAPSAISLGQRRALQLLNEIRTRRDPAADWPGFLEALWQDRGKLRPDLKPSGSGRPGA